jgi:anti-sigma-K factor RskA
MSHERERDCDGLRDDLAAYALGALGGDDAVALERHLATCPDCEARLRWLTPAVDLLPVAVEQRTPPPRLRANLMETVRADATRAAPAAEPEPGRRGSWFDSLRGLALRPAAGTAVLILLVVGVGAGYLLRGSDTVAPPVEVTKAQSLNASAPVSATLQRNGDTATLHVNELPAIAEDEVYEIWVQRAGVMEPSGTFVLESNGSAVAAVHGSVEGGEAIFVTREPHGGSRQPTTEPILTAPL